MIDAPLPYPIHPLAAVQPPLRKARYQALVASVPRQLYLPVGVN